MTSMEGQINREEIISEHRLVVGRVAEIISPGYVESGLTPLDVLPRSSDTRRDTPFNVELSPEQEAAVRTAMIQLEVGKVENTPASEVGLRAGYVALYQGGLEAKLSAQRNVVDKDSVQPSAYVHAALPGKEMDNVLAGATSQEGFEPFEEPVALPYVYTYDRFTKEASVQQVEDPAEHGQLVQIGNRDGKPVVIMRVDREYYPDPKPDDAHHRSYAQPGPRASMDIVDSVLTMEQSRGDQAVLLADSETQIGFVTSHLYGPSSTLAALGARRQTGVVKYGKQELATVKGTEMTDPPLNQIAAEAYEAALIASK